MSAARSAGLPRPLAWLGLTLLALVLIAFFVATGFPYDALGRRISSEARNAGIALDIRGLGPQLGLAGPGFRADAVAFGQGSKQILFEDAKLRPAWSLQWFSGNPALHVDLASDIGSAVGTLVLGQDTGFSGTLRQVRLEKLPLGDALRGFAASGLLDAEPDLIVHGAQGPAPRPEGTLVFQVKDGSISLPNLPMGLPFTSLDGDLVFGAENYADVNQLDLAGPMVSAKVEGHVAASDAGLFGPLDVLVDLTAQDPLTRNVITRQAGVRLDREGRAKLAVKGSLMNPLVQGGSAGRPNPFE